MRYCFFCVFSFLFQINNLKVELQGLKKTYKTNESICFTIAPTKNIYYYIGVDYNNGNGWFELINDVTNPTSNTSLIQKTNGKNQIKTIHISKVFYRPNFLKFKKYRIKVIYGESIKRLHFVKYSNSFILTS